MSTWSPNAQLAALQFSGLVSFVIALQFLYLLAVNGVTAFSPDNAILQSSIFELLKLIPLILGVFFLFRYLLQCRQLKVATSWRSMAMILRDEYALSVYRNAGAKAFTLFYFLCFGIIYLSSLDFNSPAMATFLSAQTVSAALMFSTSIVFGCVVLSQLYDEDA